MKVPVTSRPSQSAISKLTATGRNPEVRSARGRTHPISTDDLRKGCTHLDRRVEVETRTRRSAPGPPRTGATDRSRRALRRGPSVHDGKPSRRSRGPRGGESVGDTLENQGRRQTRSPRRPPACPKTGAGSLAAEIEDTFPRFGAFQRNQMYRSLIRWVASPTPSALRVSHPPSGLIPVHPRDCVSSRIHS
jgi:hypothetical protein